MKEREKRITTLYEIPQSPKKAHFGMTEKRKTLSN